MEGKLYDIVVVGAGNAALCAALSANEAGPSVLVLEKAPRSDRGGNSRVTGGARYAYGDMDGLRALFPDLITDEVVERLEVETYTVDDYYGDLMQASQGRADPELSMVLAEESVPWVKWLQSKGVKYHVKWEQTEGWFERENGKRYCSIRMGGSPCGPTGRNLAVLNRFFDIIEQSPTMEIRYETKAVKLTVDGTGRVTGVRVKDASGFHDLPAKAVILACGGFEANPGMRAKYLGPGWDLVKVRGSRYDTGEGLEMGLEIGAAMAGNISGCHATNVFMSGPDVEMGDLAHAHRYPYGIEVNIHGKRFVDEGSDFETYTYARIGRAVLAQPGAVAYQIFDAKVRHLHDERYRADDPGHEGRGVSARSLEELADAVVAKGLRLDKAALIATIREFNAAVQEGNFDPSVLDGKQTVGIDPPKSNWALPIDTPPFLCYPVTCGITFTYGGLKIDRHARVLDTEGKVIPGLYASGEVAGTFYDNYMGGAGIAKGGVFGRIAGRSAAAEISGKPVGA